MRPTGKARPTIYPGEILGDELKEIGVSATELARQLAVPPNRTTQVIQGRRSITGDTALRLAHWFGADPLFCLNLQASYELDVALAQVGTEIRKLPRRAGVAA